MSTTSTVTARLGDTPWEVTFTDDLGHTWRADEPESIGGANTATTPDRLVLSGLGSCTAITVKMVAVRKQIPLEGIEVDVQLNPDGKPESGNDLVRTIRLQGNLDDDQRAQLLKAANACPVHKLLTGEIRIHTSMQQAAPN
ncbi:OsmC family protein [Burkholderiaceae bacterium DAT-1]|nr:OsmC family protein [Burkholderiaceae bacterium DAT-1]